jgi:hypothetical protein
LLLFSTIRNFRIAEVFKSCGFCSPCGVSTTLVRRRTIHVQYFYAIGQILKVFTYEKRDQRDELKVVLIDRSHFKQYTQKFSKNLCRPPSCERPKTVEVFYTIPLYLEYQGVCPFVRIGSPRLLYRKRVCPPPRKQRGGATLACGLGCGGSQ